MGMRTENVSSPENRAGRRTFPRWKKIVLTAAAFVLALGVGLKAYALVKSRAGPTGSEKVAADQRNLVGGKKMPGTAQPLVEGRGESPRWEGGPAAEGDEEDKKDTVDKWSPALLKGGMSFFLGFCIGYALRQFFKISAVLIGVVLLAIFGLSYAGVIPPIDWTAIQGHFDRLVASLREEAGQVKAFILANLPSAGMAGAGLFTGFKRH